MTAKKPQPTIPEPARTTSDLQVTDEPEDDDPFATFTEWQDAADTQDYADLGTGRQPVPTPSNPKGASA